MARTAERVIVVREDSEVVRGVVVAVAAEAVSLVSPESLGSLGRAASERTSEVSDYDHVETLAASIHM